MALDALSTRWADEMLPLAKEAHDRLTNTKLAHPIHSGSYTYHWLGGPSGADYSGFATRTVDASIHRGGWRLAKLLEQLL